MLGEEKKGNLGGIFFYLLGEKKSRWDFILHFLIKPVHLFGSLEYMLPTNIISEATEDRKLLSCQTTQWGQNIFENLLYFKQFETIWSFLYNATSQ